MLNYRGELLSNIFHCLHQQASGLKDFSSRNEMGPASTGCWMSLIKLAKWLVKPGRNVGKQPNKALRYIDALRGYAILMVIAVHSSQYFSDLPHTVKGLAIKRARVQLFFRRQCLTLLTVWGRSLKYCEECHRNHHEDRISRSASM